jgi:hypothetical protein
MQTSVPSTSDGRPDVDTSERAVPSGTGDGSVSRTRQFPPAAGSLLVAAVSRPVLDSDSVRPPRPVTG